MLFQQNDALTSEINKMGKFRLIRQKEHAKSELVSSSSENRPAC